MIKAKHFISVGSDDDDNDDNDADITQTSKGYTAVFDKGRLGLDVLLII